MAHSGNSGGTWDRNKDYSLDRDLWKSSGAGKSSRYDSPQHTESYSSQVEQRHKAEGDGLSTSRAKVSTYASTSNTIIPHSGRWAAPSSFKRNHSDFKHNALPTARDEDHDPNLSNSRRVDGPPRVVPTKPSPNRRKHKPPPDRPKGSSVFSTSKRNEANRTDRTITSNRQFNRFSDRSVSEDTARSHYPWRILYSNDRESTYPSLSNLHIPQFTSTYYDSIRSQVGQGQTPSGPFEPAIGHDDQLLTPDSMSFSSPEPESRSITEDDFTLEESPSHNQVEPVLSAAPSMSTHSKSTIWDVEQVKALNAPFSDPIPGLQPDNWAENGIQESQQTPLKRPPSPSQGPEPKRPRLEPDTPVSAEADSPNTLHSTHLATDLAPSTLHIPIEAIPLSPQIKRESSPILPPDPIDVDAPPLSLYEQLGLPVRTSGSHRVIRPIFKRSDPRGKERWTEQICDDIRWVRGRGEGAQPLIIGNIFWRSDGVCFDWKVSDEELQQRSSLQSRPLASSARNAQRESSPIIETNDGVHGSPSSILPLERDGHNDPPRANTEERIGPVVVKEEVDDTSNLLSLALYNRPLADSNTSNGADDVKGEDLVSSRSLPERLPPHTLSNIAICFLDRFTRCFDHPAAHPRLAEAYTSDAVMSLQFSDLPTTGVCPRVGRPERQSHLIMDFASRDHGRNLHCEKLWGHRRLNDGLAIGPQAIVDRLSSFDDLTHISSMGLSQPYQFDVLPLHELGSLLLNFRGELYTRAKGDGNEGSVGLRFDRTLILQPNNQEMYSW
ncbi:hypothetical protein FS842_002776 [Serendipita sp. 407]|nr:hypothetical protein FS842_002776 [Serendipita sp. 407]